MNNMFDEIKAMLNALNEEVEGLREENRELKRRLEKYESVNETELKGSISLKEMFSVEFSSKNVDFSRLISRAYNALEHNCIESVKDLREKRSLRNLLKIRGAGLDTVALIVVVAEHYGIEFEDDLYKGKEYDSFCLCLEKMKKSIVF